MENDEFDIDQLSANLKRAQTLIKLCRDKLTKTDAEIKKLLGEEKEWAEGNERAKNRGEKRKLKIKPLYFARVI